MGEVNSLDSVDQGETQRQCSQESAWLRTPIFPWLEPKGALGNGFMKRDQFHFRNEGPCLGPGFFPSLAPEGKKITGKQTLVSFLTNIFFSHLSSHS